MREWNAANPEKRKSNDAKKYAKRHEAASLTAKLWRTNNAERYAINKKHWRDNNLEKAHECEKAYRDRNIEKEKERNREKRIRNKQQIMSYQKRYHADHPGLRTARNAKRNAAKKKATQAWANKFFIVEAYRLAKLREKVCGGRWNVDHIVPLQSKLVCGLHVEHNLRVVTQTENQRKSNMFWPDMP